MFEDTADKIFERAGVDKVKHHDLYQEAIGILNAQMASLSVNMGLSKKRVDIFEKQKDTLVEDLKKMKASGKID